MNKDDFLDFVFYTRSNKKGQLNFNSFFLQYVLLSVLISISLIFLLGLRNDFTLLYLDKNFLAQTLIAFFIFIFVGFVSARSSFPIQIPKSHLFALLAIFLVWPFLIFYFNQGNPDIGLKEHSAMCSTFVFINSLLFGVFTYYFLSRAFVLNTIQTLRLSLLSSASLAFFTLQFICPGTFFSHLFYWHFLPVVIAPLVLTFFLKRIA